MKQCVAVVESNPGERIIQRSRERHFDLLTGDATDDDVLALCNVEHARGLIALTESDTMNLETALSARAHSASLPIVLRVNELGLGDSIRRHFGLARTFDAAALSAPAFAGLAFHPGSRGRVVIGSSEYAVSERDANDVAPMGNAGQGIPLCVRRNGAILPARELGEIRENDLVLLLYPLPKA
jgi:voltage-gated potassium channel Kch